VLLFFKTKTFATRKQDVCTVPRQTSNKSHKSKKARVSVKPINYDQSTNKTVHHKLLIQNTAIIKGVIFSLKLILFQLVYKQKRTPV